jgi:radical SAM superfamily enzyme YgiQ (UPF0313 family)
MAKILFFQSNIVNESIGVQCLSSYLKANGHEVELSLLSKHKTFDALLSEVMDFNPHIMGFSVMTPEAEYFQTVTKELKQNTGCTIIWGGAHCIFMPNVVTENSDVDIICIGEGEEALLMLMNRIEAGKDYVDIPGLWVRNNGTWKKNEIGY